MVEMTLFLSSFSGPDNQHRAQVLEGVGLAIYVSGI